MNRIVSLVASLAVLLLVLTSSAQNAADPIVVQTDERIEVLYLAENLLGYEGLEWLGENQVPPLRQAARDQFRALDKHPFLVFYRAIDEKKGAMYLPDQRLALSISPWPEMKWLDDPQAIADSLYDSPSGWYAKQASRDEIRKDVRDWGDLFIKFWRDSGFHEFYVAHQRDYAEIESTFRQTLMKSGLADWMSREQAGVGAPYVMIPTPLARPGRNWSVAFTRPSAPDAWLRYTVFGPYKKVPLAMFTAGRWSDAPIGFDDATQALTLGFHEFLHSVMRPLLAKPHVLSLINGCQPDEKLFKDVLGPAYGEADWSKVFDECLVRAYVDAFVRDDVSPLRAELDLRGQEMQGIHLVPLMYGVLEMERAESGRIPRLDAALVGKVADAIKGAKRLTSDVNQWSMGLGSFIGSFVPAFLSGPKNTKIVISPSALPSAKRDGIINVIHERIFKKWDDASINSAILRSFRPLSASDLFVFNYDEGGASALSREVLEGLKVKVDGDKVIVPNVGTFKREGLALISKTRNPEVKDGTVVSFIVFDPSLPPEQVIPTWADEFDAALVRYGEVVAAWTLPKK